MKIACITFFKKGSEFGGAQTPAYAFSEWARKLGHRPYVIHVDERTNNLDDILKDFDFAFLNTPPRYEVSTSYIKIPYVFMLHVEQDLQKYPSIEALASSPFCKGLIHIDYDNDMFKDIHSVRIPWHPCCSPKYLLRNEVPNYSREGILYAGRITPWKNIHLMKEISERFGETYHIMGEVSNINYAQDHKIESKPYDIEKDEAMILARYSQHDLFWDVCGNEENKMEVHRMNLTAYEALHHGLMPIVNKNAMTEDMKGIFIEVTLPINEQELLESINEYRRHKCKYFKFASDRVQQSHAGYNTIELQIKKIISLFEERKNDVSSLLRDAANLFESKNLEYGNAYIDHPKLMYQLFGNIELKSEDDYAMLFRSSAIVAKLNRVAKNFSKGGHKDSAKDMVVFSAMLQELLENNNDNS